MKRTLTAVLVCAMLAITALASGCASGKVTPSPSPMATPKVTVAPTTAPTEPAATALPPANSPDTTPGGEAGAGTIEGFEEGKTVDETAMAAVKKAVTAKYPDAKIKSATFETYQDKQAYHVILEEAVDGNTDIYVFADGTVTPMTTGGSSTSGS